MKRVIGAFVVAAALMTVLPAVAQDEDPLGWFGGTYDDTTVFAYGIPDSDYVLLFFSCRPGAPAVKLGLNDDESSAEAGDMLDVRLAAGDASVRFSSAAVVNEDSGGIELNVELPLDEALRRILTAQDTLDVTIGENTRHYDMAGATGLAAALIASCDAPRPANDLDVTVTNAARRPVQNLAYSEAGLDWFDGDTFGYEPLEPGTSRTFTIPAGRDICTFDVSVTFVEDDDAECCSMGEPAGTQNLCENSAFVIHEPAE